MTTTITFGKSPFRLPGLVLTGVLLAGCGGQESQTRSPSLSYVMAQVKVGSSGGSWASKLDFSPMTKYIYEGSSWQGEEEPYWGPFVVHMLTGYGTELSQFGQVQEECSTQITFSPRDRHVVLNYRGYAGEITTSSPSGESKTIMVDYRDKCYSRAEVWDPGGTLLATIPFANCVHFSPDGEYMLCEDVVYEGTGNRYVRRPDGRFVRYNPGSGEFTRIDSKGRVHEWDVETRDGTFSLAIDGSELFKHSLKLDTKDLFFHGSHDPNVPCCLLARAGGVFATYVHKDTGDAGAVQDMAVILAPDGSTRPIDVREEIKAALGSEPDIGQSHWRVSESGDFILWYATGKKWRIVAFSSSGKEVGRLSHDDMDEPKKETSLTAADFIGGRNYIYAEFTHEGAGGYEKCEVFLLSPDVEKVGGIDPDIIGRAPVFSPGGDRFILTVGPWLDELSKVSGSPEEEKYESWQWVPKLYQSFSDRGIDLLVSRIGSAYKDELGEAKALGGKPVEPGTYVFEKTEVIHHVLGPTQIDLISKSSHLILVESDGAILMKGPELGFADRSNSPRDWCAAKGKKKGGIVVFKGFHLLAPGMHADEASAFLVKDPQSGDLTLTVARRTALGEITRYVFRSPHPDELPVDQPLTSKTTARTIASKELESFISSATWAIEKGELGDARLALDKSAKINPVDPRMLTLRGTVAAIEGDIASAGRDLRMAIYAGSGDPAHAALSAVRKGDLEARLSQLAGSTPGENDQKRISAVAAKFRKLQKAGNANALGLLLAQRDMALLAGYPDSRSAALYINTVTRFLCSKEIVELLDQVSTSEVSGGGDLATVRVVSPTGLNEQMVLVKKRNKWRVIRFILPGSEIAPDPDQEANEAGVMIRGAINKPGTWSRIRGVIRAGHTGKSHDLRGDLYSAVRYFVASWVRQKAPVGLADKAPGLYSHLEKFITGRKDPQIVQAAKKYEAANMSDTVPFGMSSSIFKQGTKKRKSLYSEAKNLFKKKKVGKAIQKALLAQALLPWPDPTITASIKKWNAKREAFLEAKMAFQWASEGNIAKVLEATERARTLDKDCPLLKKLDKKIKNLKKADKVAGALADQAEQKLEQGDEKAALKLALEALGLIQVHLKALAILGKIGEKSEGEIALKKAVAEYEDENAASAAREEEYDAEMKAIEDKIPGWKKKAKKYAKKLERMAKKDISKAKKKAPEATGSIPDSPAAEPAAGVSGGSQAAGLYYFKWGVDSLYWDNAGKFGPYHSLDECSSERTRWLNGEIEMELGPPSCDPDCPEYYMDDFKFVAAHCYKK